MSKPEQPNLTQSDERNVIKFLKKLATDGDFAESLRRAGTVAERRDLIERAGIQIDFTNSEVMQQIDRLRLMAAHERGTAGGAKTFERSLADVVDALGALVSA